MDKGGAMKRYLLHYRIDDFVSIDANSEEEAEENADILGLIPMGADVISIEREDFDANDERVWNDVQNIADRIKQLRLELLVHSVIYYELNDNIITDAEWSKRAMELVSISAKYPEIAENTPLAEMYKGFDGSTGFDLAAKADDAARGKAKYLLMNRRKKHG